MALYTAPLSFLFTAFLAKIRFVKLIASVDDLVSLLVFFAGTEGMIEKFIFFLLDAVVKKIITAVKLMFLTCLLSRTTNTDGLIRHKKPTREERAQA